MKQYDVTIGIPVYNSVDRIQMSLISALSQSYSSIEFLLIDDGCTDGTFDVVDHIIECNDRRDDVHIIKHQVNQGVSASRNQIIDEAMGQYMYFMDSDDTIEANTVELMMRNVRQYDAEIVFGSYIRIDTSGKVDVYQYPSLQFLKENELASFAYRKYAGIQASACNFLVKTSILRNHNHHFINLNFWEDLVFTFDLVTFVSRAVLLSDITYSYLCREGSLSHYQERRHILKNEVMQNVQAIDHLKKTSSALNNKVYFPNRCFNIVMTDFYIACHILKRRHDIYPRITNQEIKLMMGHPATLQQIVHFRQSRIPNLFLFLMGCLPSSLCIVLVRILGKIKKLI